MTLHIISQSPHQTAALKDCLKVFSPENDDIIFVSDGVYIINTDLADNISKTIYLLESDYRLRGSIPSLTTSTYQLINHDELVNLTEQHNNCATWY